MILVTGASGKTGNAVVKALAAKGADVRALVRRAEQAPALRVIGAVEVAIGSFDEPATLMRAADGANAIYHICPNVSRHELSFAETVAAAARVHGVKRFVFHSVLHPQIEAMPHHWQKMRTEEMLLAAGFDLTILQPTAYMQNILAAWRGRRRGRRIPRALSDRVAAEPGRPRRCRRSRGAGAHREWAYRRDL